MNSFSRRPVGCLSETANASMSSDPSFSIIQGPFPESLRCPREKVDARDKCQPKSVRLPPWIAGPICKLPSKLQVELDCCGFSLLLAGPEERLLHPARYCPMLLRHNIQAIQFVF